MVIRVFHNVLEDRSSISVWVIPKTQKLTPDDFFLLNIQYYKLRIKGKWDNP